MTYSYVTCLIHTWHASFICDMPHLYMTWLIHVRHKLFIYDMTYSYMTCLIHTWHDSFIRDMTHSYVTCLIHVWRDPFLCDMTRSCETWLICLWHELIHVTWLIHIYIATASTTPTHAHVNTHPQKDSTEPQHIHSLLFQLTHLHASLHSLFVVVQIWEAPCWKRPVRDIHTQRVRRCVLHRVEVRSSVLQCVAVWFRVLQGETSYQTRSTAHQIRRTLHQNTHVCHLICALNAIKRVLHPDYSCLPSNYDGTYGLFDCPFLSSRIAWKAWKEAYRWWRERWTRDVSWSSIRLSDAQDMHTRCTPHAMPRIYHQKTSATHLMSQEPYPTSPNPYWPSCIPYMPSNEPYTASTLSCDMTPSGAT